MKELTTTMMQDPDYGELAGLYEITSEQSQGWRYYNDPDNNSQDFLITLDDIVKDLDIRIVERSIEMMIRRHESLRTFFRMIDGEVKQCVLPYSKELFSPSYHDISLEENKEIAARRILDIQKERLAKIDIPPLFLSCIFKISGDTWYLCLMIHHIISDAWSRTVIHRELSSFYEFFKGGGKTEILPLKMQLKDYAQWQKKWLGDNAQPARDYWANNLEDFNSGPGIVIGAGRKTLSQQQLLDIVKTGRSASWLSYIDQEAYNSLAALSLSCKASIFSIISASFQLLFLSWAQKEKILIAMPVVNRFLPGSDKIIGNLGGGMYLFHKIRQDLTVKEYIKEVYYDFLQSSRYLIYDHFDMKLDGQGLRAYSDIFLNYVNKDILGDRKMNIKEESEHRMLDSPEYYGLSNMIVDYRSGIMFDWKYNLQLYSAKTIEFMAERQRAILHALCANPEITIKELIDSLTEVKSVYDRENIS
ncbi:MAG TPA: condensation domain-containing protein [Puia sp.]|jgi:hypothetical protein|nr:condensation domain-containing protein [Puia sp.]